MQTFELRVQITSVNSKYEEKYKLMLATKIAEALEELREEAEDESNVVKIESAFASNIDVFKNFFQNQTKSINNEQ